MHRSSASSLPSACLLLAWVLLPPRPGVAQVHPEQEEPPASAAVSEAVTGHGDWVFHTFSIAAVDPETGETGVAVTTRNSCVGNGVPWVRAGVGAVATQASTRVEYGTEILDLLQDGADPRDALATLLAGDPGAPRRQVGIVSADGRTAQHTGGETVSWAGHRAGPGYAVQGNLLVGPEVLDAVAESFEATRHSGRHLADRLVGALQAGQAEGGDLRHGRIQSAAVLVADPRPEVARRPDGQTVFIHVCEHPKPVEELRRIHDTVAGTLGYRALQGYAGGDVAQLKIILHLLGYLRPGTDSLPREQLMEFDAEAQSAVDAFRSDQGLATASMGVPPSLVDGEVVRRLWIALEEAGLESEARRRIRPFTQIRR
ncbi:MAG: DUF1028 domain-containing protein [Gemmatimonadales bacterium]|nr:MAG: DUF1028 domain-containing protein [Gemmatimonadales bacterium]